MYYFAYGSNISSARILKRVPSALFVSKGYLKCHSLRFHKVGKDGSAKCDAFYSGIESDFVIGVIYKINPAQKIYLDEAEGLGKGYNIKIVKVDIDNSDHIDVMTYYATNIKSGIKPFNWYKQHVIAGFMEYDFPKEYIEKIQKIESVIDNNKERRNLESIY